VDVLNRRDVGVAALALLLVGCNGGGSSGPGADDLEGIMWILDASSIEALVEEPPADARVTVRFEGGEVGGTAACNIYGGTYELGDDGAISIEVTSMTEMACDEALMALESAFVQALGEVASVSVSGDALALSWGEVGLTFAAEQPAPLEGTPWRLDGITTGFEAVSSVLAGTEITALFEDGTVSGNGGCNTYSGGYTVDGDGIEIGPLASTAMACADPAVGTQESAYFAALGRAASFGIEGSTLTLLDEEGGFLLSYVGTPA
jgi:heat shock protein HslJ